MKEKKILKNWMKFLTEMKVTANSGDSWFHDNKYQIQIYPTFKNSTNDDELFEAAAFIINNCGFQNYTISRSAEELFPADISSRKDYNKKPSYCKNLKFTDVLEKKYGFQTNKENIVKEKIKSLVYKASDQILKPALQNVEQNLISSQSIKVYQNFLNKNKIINFESSEMLKNIRDNLKNIYVYINFSMWPGNTVAAHSGNIIWINAEFFYLHTTQNLIRTLIHELYHHIDSDIYKYIKEMSMTQQVDLPGDTNPTAVKLSNDIIKQIPMFNTRIECATSNAFGLDSPESSKQNNSTSFETKEGSVSSEMLKTIIPFLKKDMIKSLTTTSMVDPRDKNRKYYSYELSPTEMFVRLKKLRELLINKYKTINFNSLKSFINDQNPKKYGDDYEIQSLIDVLDLSSDQKIMSFINWLNSEIAKAPIQQKSMVAESYNFKRFLFNLQ